MSSDNPTTRTRILQATRDLLDSNPGTAARMSDIAKRAGVSRQALYLHFPNRTELFIAATRHQDAVHGLNAALDVGICSGSGADRLSALVAAWGGYIPHIFGMAKTLMVLKETDEEAARAWNERMADFRDACAAVVAALARDGDLVMDETEATDLLWTLLSIPTWEHLTRLCGWPQARYLDEITRLSRQALTEA
ncbi:TetR/AcrR family transcriptional regulator [Roseovarius ramblicola]|uniref:TetR/AcrR family transcriptional regulator n=1 Tax=Roseovarius ramblicola TaxID=2022336 RepID=A0ABV5HZ59_9RHOB